MEAVLISSSDSAEWSCGRIQFLQNRLENHDLADTGRSSLALRLFLVAERGLICSQGVDRPAGGRWTDPESDA